MSGCVRRSATGSAWRLNESDFDRHDLVLVEVVGLIPFGTHIAAAAAPATPAPDDAAGYASERDTAEHIAICRASYAAVSDQLNQILDIEDERERRRAATPR